MRDYRGALKVRRHGSKALVASKGTTVRRSCRRDLPRRSQRFKCSLVEEQCPEQAGARGPAMGHMGPRRTGLHLRCSLHYRVALRQDVRWCMARCAVGCGMRGADGARDIHSLGGQRCTYPSTLQCSGAREPSRRAPNAVSLTAHRNVLAKAAPLPAESQHHRLQYTEFYVDVERTREALPTPGHLA